MVRQRLAAAAVATLAFVGLGFAVATPAQAVSESSWYNGGKVYDAGGGHHDSYVEAWYSAWNCGIKICASAGWLYADTITVSGTIPNLSRVKESIAFGGGGLSVYVAVPAGVSAGFTDLGSSCGAGEYSYGQSYSNYASSDTPDYVCSANTLGYISGTSAANYNGVRYASSWTNQTASASHNINGYF